MFCGDEEEESRIAHGRQGGREEAISWLQGWVHHEEALEEACHTLGGERGCCEGLGYDDRP